MWNIVPWRDKLAIPKDYIRWGRMHFHKCVILVRRAMRYENYVDRPMGSIHSIHIVRKEKRQKKKEEISTTQVHITSKGRKRSRKQHWKKCGVVLSKRCLQKWLHRDDQISQNYFARMMFDSERFLLLTLRRLIPELYSSNKKKNMQIALLLTSVSHELTSLYFVLSNKEMSSSEAALLL